MLHLLLHGIPLLFGWDLDEAHTGTEDATTRWLCQNRRMGNDQLQRRLVQYGNLNFDAVARLRGGRGSELRRIVR